MGPVPGRADRAGGDLVSAGADDDLRPHPHFATAITFGNLGLAGAGRVQPALAGLAARPAPPLEPAFKIAGRRGQLLRLVPVADARRLARRAGAADRAADAPAREVARPAGPDLRRSAVMLGAVYLGSSIVQSRIHAASTEYDVAVNGEAQAAEVQASAPPAKPAAAAAKKPRATSIGLRLEFWRTAIDLFLREPLVGVGAQNIQAEYRHRIAQGKMSPAAARFGHVHNDYLQAWPPTACPACWPGWRPTCCPVVLPARDALGRLRAGHGRLHGRLRGAGLHDVRPDRNHVRHHHERQLLLRPAGDLRRPFAGARQGRGRGRARSLTTRRP